MGAIVLLLFVFFNVCLPTVKDETRAKILSLITRNLYLSKSSIKKLQKKCPRFKGQPGSFTLRVTYYIL